MGGREYVYIDHGFDKDRLKMMGIVGTTKNLYVSFNTYYPEILFITMALNDFINNYERKVKHPEWNAEIQAVRNFQATVIESLHETVSKHTFTSMINNMNLYRRNFSNYFTQYLDTLNIRFLNWNKETRRVNISIIAKRLAEQGEEYQNVKREITQLVNESGGTPNEFRPIEEYPEEVDW